MPIIISYAFQLIGLIPFNLKQNPRKTSSRSTKYPFNSFFSFFSIISITPQGVASIIKYKRKLQRLYTKLKSKEKIDIEEIQDFICGLIAFAYRLELIT